MRYEARKRLNVHTGNSTWEVWDTKESKVAKSRMRREYAEAEADRLNLSDRFPLVPVPVKNDSRICFGISFFETEETADYFAEYVKARGDTYNGGYMHGVRCGRDKTFDHTDKTTGQKLYAVTTR